MNYTLRNLSLSLLTIITIMATSQITKAVDHCGGEVGPQSPSYICPGVCAHFEGTWNAPNTKRGPDVDAYAICESECKDHCMQGDLRCSTWCHRRNTRDYYTCDCTN